MLSAALVAARRSNGPPAFSVPLRTASPGPCSTGRASPVSADSSSTATPEVTAPSTGSTSPGATSSTSPIAIASSGTVSSDPPRYRRAVLGARASRAFRSCRARSAAHASRERPLVSMTLITAAASSSPNRHRAGQRQQRDHVHADRPRRKLSTADHNA